MAINTGQAIAVGYKVQSAKGAGESGSGGTGLKIAPSPGLQLVKNTISNPTIRDDGLSDRDRGGTRHVAGSYAIPHTLDGVDAIIQAVFRNTFSGGTLTQSTVERYFTFDEYRTIIAKSKSFIDCKVTKLNFSAQADAVIMLTATVMGLEANGGSGPVLTDLTFSTGLPLVMADGTITINGVEYCTLTGFSFDLDLGGEAPSGLCETAADVFLANPKLSGTFTAMHQDMVFFDAFKNETQSTFLIEMAEKNGPGTCEFYIGNAMFTGDDTPLGGSSFMPETVPWSAGAYTNDDDVDTMIEYTTSNQS